MTMPMSSDTGASLPSAILVAAGTVTAAGWTARSEEMIVS